MKKFITVATLLTLSACGAGSPTPTQPTQPTTPTGRASVTITAFSASGVLSGSQYRYSMPIALQNTGGATATIASVVFRVIAPGEPLRSATFSGAEAFGTASLAPAASTSRPTLVVTDTADHAFASSISVVVDYSDAAGTNSATQSVDVPALPSTPVPPTPTSVTVAGTVTEPGIGPLAGANIEIRDGPDAKKNSNTDAAGKYALSGLQPGTFTVRAQKSGYSDTDQRVTVAAGTTTVNFNVPKTTTPVPTPPTPQPSSCAPATGSCGTATARCSDGTLSCSQNRSGTCSSHGGVQCFICPGFLCGGLNTSGESLFTPAPTNYTPAQPIRQE